MFSHISGSKGTTTLANIRYQCLDKNGLGEDDYPLRPLLWRIFLGILSAPRASDSGEMWIEEMKAHRENYDALVEKHLTDDPDHGPFHSHCPPFSPVPPHLLSLFHSSFTNFQKMTMIFIFTILSLSLMIQVGIR